MPTCRRNRVRCIPSPGGSASLAAAGCGHPALRCHGKSVRSAGVDATREVRHGRPFRPPLQVLLAADCLHLNSEHGHGGGLGLGDGDLPSRLVGQDGLQGTTLLRRVGDRRGMAGTGDAPVRTAPAAGTVCLYLPTIREKRPIRSIPSIWTGTVQGQRTMNFRSSGLPETAGWSVPHTTARFPTGFP